MISEKKAAKIEGLKHFLLAREQRSNSKIVEGENVAGNISKAAVCSLEDNFDMVLIPENL